MSSILTTDLYWVEERSQADSEYFLKLLGGQKALNLGAPALWSIHISVRRAGGATDSFLGRAVGLCENPSLFPPNSLSGVNFAHGAPRRARPIVHLSSNEGGGWYFLEC